MQKEKLCGDDVNRGGFREMIDACDMIKQRCYPSGHQSYSSIRNQQLRFLECIAAEQQLLKWKENKTQHSLPEVTEANIHLRHAIVLRDLCSQPVRNRAKKEAKSRWCANIELFSPWKMWPWKSSNHYPQFKVRSESLFYVLSVL